MPSSLVFSSWSSELSSFHCSESTWEKKLDTVKVTVTKHLDMKNQLTKNSLWIRSWICQEIAVATSWTTLVSIKCNTTKVRGRRIRRLSWILKKCRNFFQNNELLK